MRKLKTDYQIYKDANQQWRWRAVAAENGQILASGEAYVDRRDAEKVVARLSGKPHFKGEATVITPLDLTDDERDEFLEAIEHIRTSTDKTPEDYRFHLAHDAVVDAEGNDCA